MDYRCVVELPRQAAVVAALVTVAAVASAAFGYGDGDSGEPASLAYMPWLVEAARVVERHADDVWPGWRVLAPVLVRDGPHEYLVGHPFPPQPFAPVHHLDGTVHRIDGHVTPAPVATTWPVGDVWSVAIPAPHELQSIVDRALGPDVVVIDAPTYVRAILHEAFHAHQLTTVGGVAGVPRFGLDGTHATERGAVQALMSKADLDARHAAVGATLAAALEAPTDEEAVRFAHQFLNQRDEHRRTLSDEVAAFERSLEWIEGTARYADTRLMVIVADDPDRSDSVAYGTADGVWRTFVEQLQDPAGHGVGLRDRYAAIGAAQALLLDRLHPGWHGRVLGGAEAIEDVLRDAVGRSPETPP